MKLLLALFGFIFAAASVSGVILVLAFTDFPRKLRRNDRSYIISLIGMSIVLGVCSVLSLAEAGLL